MKGQLKCRNDPVSANVVPNFGSSNILDFPKGNVYAMYRTSNTAKIIKKKAAIWNRYYTSEGVSLDRFWEMKLNSVHTFGI